MASLSSIINTYKNVSRQFWNSRRFTYMVEGVQIDGNSFGESLPILVALKFFAECLLNLIKF